MNDKEKNEGCDPVKTEEEIAEDSRVIMQVDDKLIGDDKLIPSLMPKPDKKNDSSDSVY